MTTFYCLTTLRLAQISLKQVGRCTPFFTVEAQLLYYPKRSAQAHGIQSGNVGKFGVYGSDNYWAVHQVVSTTSTARECHLVVPQMVHHCGRAVSGLNCLRSLEHWDLGFESHSSHGCLCVRLFCACVFLCVGSDLATG
jgi:hypothetical protein